MPISSVRFDEYIDEHRDEIVGRIRELVRINSIEGTPEEGKPFGEGPYEALSYALRAGEELGLGCANLDGYAGYIEYGEGEEIVGVLVHVDTVPVGEGWTGP